MLLIEYNAFLICKTTTSTREKERAQNNKNDEYAFHYSRVNNKFWKGFDNDDCRNNILIANLIDFLTFNKLHLRLLHFPFVSKR